ncbi:MAG: hypothetical protein ACTSVU_01470 [Promethearchaeota archaeon]
MNLRINNENQKQQALKEYKNEIVPILSEFMEKYGNQWRRLDEDQ